MDIDILSVMKSIVNSYVRYYQSDFDIDTESIKEAAMKPERTDRIFVWLCRESGTCLLKEKNVFIQDTRENYTFRFYKEQTRDIIQAFIVEIATFDRDTDTVTGNLYAIDYRKYYEHVKEVAVPAKSIVITYEYGRRIIPASTHFRTIPDKEFGQFISFQFIPQSPEQLECVLIDEKRTRNKFKEEYEVLYYEIYECPTSPTESGKYFGKTSTKKQAETIALKAKEKGKHFFIKAVCTDGKKRYC